MRASGSVVRGLFIGAFAGLIAGCTTPVSNPSDGATPPTYQAPEDVGEQAETTFVVAREPGLNGRQVLVSAYRSAEWRDGAVWSTDNGRGCSITNIWQGHHLHVGFTSWPAP